MVNSPDGRLGPGPMVSGELEPVYIAGVVFWGPQNDATFEGSRCLGYLRV